MTKDERMTVSREELYSLVWKEPMVKIAEQFGVSSSYLARVCTLLNVPRPDRGYWAKLAVGKRVGSKPALPDALAGDDTTWTVGTMPSVANASPQDGSTLSRLRALRGSRPGRAGAANRTTQHPLIRGVHDLFATGRLSYDIDYLKPQKRLVPDIIVSKAALDKALTFANELYSALDAAGFRTVIANHGDALSRAKIDLYETKQRGERYFNLWAPARCTVVYVNGTPVGLTIFEMTEDVAMRYAGGKYVKESDYKPPERRFEVDSSWKTTRTCGTGRLCLQAFSPYDGATWITQWRERTDRPLAAFIPEVVRALPAGASEIAAQRVRAVREREEWRRQWEEDEARRRAEESRQRAAAAVQSSKKALLQVITAWDEAQRVNTFFEALESVALSCTDSAQKLERLERIQKAKELIGPIDPWPRLLEWKTPDERLAVGLYRDE